MQLFDDETPVNLRRIGEILGPLRSFEPPVSAALAATLQSINTRPQTIADADLAQRQVTEVLLAHEHRAAAFLKIYHGITLAVDDALGRGVLTPRPFFERLAGRFAERHFDGLKAELGLDRSSDAARYGLWRPSFAFDNLAEDPGTPLGKKPPLAHFTVGMCCHINFDLAVALDETIREQGLQGRPDVLAEVERGHNFVDTILADKVQRSTEVLATELGCPMSQKIIESKMTAEVGGRSMITIRRWRADTFPRAIRLSEAEDEPARAAIRREIYRDGARRTAKLFNSLPVGIEATLSGLWRSS